MPDQRLARPQPKYRHYKPKDLGVVRIDGRDVYLGKYNSPESLERYHRLLAERSARLISPPAPATPKADEGPDQGPTVSETIVGFLRHADGYYRRADGTPTGEVEGYKQSVRPLRKLYGLTPAAEFGPKKLKALRQSLIEGGLCRKTINQRVRRVVAVFAWAVAEELVPRDVHHGLKAVKGLRMGRTDARESERVRPVADELVDAIRCHVSRQVWALIEVQRVSGMRPGEACLLRTGDIDRSGPIWTYRPHYHKTEHHDHSREVYLGPRAQEILSPWLRADPTAYLFSPREALEEQSAVRRRARKTPLTPSQRARKRKTKPKKAPGERFTAHSYGNAIRRACKTAGIPHWHPNQLRHTAGTKLRKEFEIDIARVILGHRSPAVTEVYAELDREKAATVVAKIG